MRNLAHSTILMENILPIHLQEIIFSSSDPKLSRKIKALEKANKVRRIAPRIYTSNFQDTPEEIIRRNLFFIIGRLFPGALLSHRSAFDFKPTSTGHLFLTYTYTKKIALPGFVLRFLSGPPPIIGDNLLTGELFVSQKERAFLENLQVSRLQGPESKTLDLHEIEAELEKVIRVKGEIGVNELRDKARGIADQLGMQREFEKLNKMISALLNTQPARILSSPIAIARALGNPYDPLRIALFEKLFIALMQQEFKPLPEKNINNQSFKNFAFYEAYFSNYIEGTEFELEDAKAIIESNTPMSTRDEDSHDILGTYRIVSNLEEMSMVPKDANQLIEILLYRHKLMMSARVSKKPGTFKDVNNRAGETYFVDFTLVKGTLIRGFDYLKNLTDPFSKAVYMMFLISEVHPFLDGNGRIARIMMNAELVHQLQTKIIIPTVYRENYLSALRKLSRQQEPSAYIRMLRHAHEFSNNLFGEDLKEMEMQLDRSNAFKDPENAKLLVVL